LLFYRRNRLLWLIAIVLIFSFLVTLVPALFLRTSSQRFEIVKMIFDYLNYFYFLFAAALGLVSVSSHLRDRSIKMVMTKPVRPEIWLGSHFVAAALVFIGLVVINLMVTSTLMLVWRIPLQSGLVMLAATTACRCLILFSFLTFLSALVHPVLAGVLALLFQDGLFYQLSTLTASAQRLAESDIYKSFLAAIKYGLLIIYKVLPVYSPFQAEFSSVEQSLRVESVHLLPFLWTALYAATFSTLLFLLTAWALRNRRLI
jgi:ABC-type transport system involved in multi-copper enzyme maturation permease subunit